MHHSVPGTHWCTVELGKVVRGPGWGSLLLITRRAPARPTTLEDQPIVGRICRNRLTRSSIGGCVENSLAMPPPLNGFTM